MPEIKLQIWTLPHLAHLLGVPPGYLEDLASRAGSLYRFWSKPKPAGGVREFYEPKPELKRVQKKLHGLFRSLSYPNTSHYGISRRSNITNAIIHANQKVLLQFDLKDFFPSIHPTRVYKALIEEQDCSPQVASIITRLVTVNHQLPQGAPTSTDIANIVTFRLQRRLRGLAVQWGYRFTSYADDLSFSREKQLEGFRILVRNIIRDEGFSSRRSKESIATKSEVQRVTGVDISHGVGISRKKRKLWKTEIFNARRDYANNVIDQQVLKKAERRFLGRLTYVKTVKRIGQQT